MWPIVRGVRGAHHLRMNKQRALSAALAALATPPLLATPALADDTTTTTTTSTTTTTTTPTTTPATSPDTSTTSTTPVTAAPQPGGAAALAGNARGRALAPTIEQSATAFARVAPVDVRKIRAEMLASMNRSAAEDFGTFNAEHRARLGRNNYYEDRDIAVYVVPGPDGNSAYVAASRHATVLADGSILEPTVAGENGVVGSPVFGGSWDSYTVQHVTFTNSNDGGIDCTTSTAENRGRITKKRLKDRSNTLDFWGIAYSSVAEVTVYSKNHRPGIGTCDDWLDHFEMKMWSDDSRARWLEQSPKSDQAKNCTPINLSVGIEVGPVGGTVSQSVDVCEKWDVYGGNNGMATTKYGIRWDQNKKCAVSRELAEVAVMEVGAGKPTNLWAAYGVWPGNGPKSGCSANECGED